MHEPGSCNYDAHRTRTPNHRIQGLATLASTRRHGACEAPHQFFYHSFILHHLENRTKPILTSYDGRARTCIHLHVIRLLYHCAMDTWWNYDHNGMDKEKKTRSTQRAQTSLAEADHYSHIAHCKNVEPWLWKTTHPLKKKKKKKGSGSLPARRSGYATTIKGFFCSFTHLTIPRSPPKFNQFFLVLLRTRL